MRNILKRLNEPFPEDTSLQHNVRSMVWVGIFVTLFLYLLRPFGLDNNPDNPMLICLQFGILTLFVGVAYNLFSIYVVRLKKDMPSWTLWKWIVNALILVIFISAANYFSMSFLAGWKGFSWFAFFQMIISTLAVGIFPIIFSGMLIQMNAYKLNQTQARDIQTALALKHIETSTINLASESSHDDYSFAFANLLYIEAMQNYVSVCHLNKGKIEKTLLRSTIKRIELQATNSPLIRCHRSFLVNTSLIENIAGNAQGLKISLKGLPDFQIPVSRKYIPILKKLIN